MAVAIDLDRRHLVASVGDLVDDASQRAIGISGSGMSRLWIGQELHRRVQGELCSGDPAVQAEVAASVEVEMDGWTVEVVGRADAVRFADGVATEVHEIKTLHFAVDLYNLYAQERFERFRHQCRLYAWMLAAPGSTPAARLILVDIVTGEERHEEVRWAPETVEAWLRQRIHRLVAAEERRVARLDELRTAAEDLPFPFPSRRRAQETIGDAVLDSLGQSRHLLVRAPTGSGKTAGVLHPALKVALSKGHRLLFLTAKTLQQRLAVETARAMQDGVFRSLQLRAKGKMCANTEIICHEEHCPYAREYGLKLVRSGLLQSLLSADDHLDPDVVSAAATAHEVCPFEVSLDLLPEVDLVVCDYNYVFDPNIGLAAVLHRNALRDAVLVIDEAHNLVDRGREYYSPALSSRVTGAALEHLSRRDSEVFRDLAVLAAHADELVRSTVRGALEGHSTGTRPAPLPVDEIADLRLALDPAMLQYFMYKREHDLWTASDPVMDLFLTVTRLHRVLGLGGDEFVHLGSRDAEGVEEVKVFCCDASRFLGAVLDESAGAVAMSATLEPFEFYRELLGFDGPRTDQLHVPSPFPPENRLVVAIDDVDTTYRKRAQHYDAIAAWVSRLAPPGRNALALFPSYDFLRRVHERLPPVAHTILAQQPGSSDDDQARFLAALSSGEPHLVLAVLGGIFAEGVDYPGEMLSEVLVVSPGLPQYNVERELIKAYLGEVHGHGFAYAYLIPGLTRVVQAAGRLLRSEEDRGAIVLVGRRFLDPRYARLLPDEWTSGEPETMLRPDPVAAVLEFFDHPG